MKFIIQKEELARNEWINGEQLSDMSFNWDYKPNMYYTFIMYDVDAPTMENPKYSPYLHLLIVNIKGNNLKSGTTLCEYMRPQPSNNEIHRYVFVVFEQSQYINPYVITKRTNFNINMFVKHNNLKFHDKEHINYNPILHSFFIIQKV